MVISELETTEHFFLCCPFLLIESTKLFNSLCEIDLPIEKLKEDSLITLLLYSSQKYGDNAITILHDCIAHLKSANRFNRPCLTIITHSTFLYYPQQFILLYSLYIFYIPFFYSILNFSSYRTSPEANVSEASIW